MVLLAPNRFHSPGFSVLGVWGESWKKDRFLISIVIPFHVNVVFFWNWKARLGVSRGKGVREQPPPPQVATPLSSFPLPLFLLFVTFLFPSFFFSLLFHLSLQNFGPWAMRSIALQLQLYHLLWRIHDAEANLSFHSFFLSYQATPPGQLRPQVTLLQKTDEVIRFRQYKIVTLFLIQIVLKVVELQPGFWYTLGLT